VIIVVIKSALRNVVFFWLPLCLLGASLNFALLRMFSGLPPKLAETSRDIAIYRRAGEAILAGEVPYRDFFIEYPPGSLPAFVPPALFTESREAYAAFFASEMALVLVAALVFMAYAARTLGRWWPFPASVFTVAALLLYPIAVTRYDAIVALTLAAATALIIVPAYGGARAATALTVAWASLGFGAAAKLVPALATLPLALLTDYREGARTLKEAARGFAVFFGVMAVFFLPAFLFGGERFVESFTYHANRGLQLESLTSSVLMKLGWLEGGVPEYGAFDVRGRGVDFLSALSLPLTVALLVVTVAVMYREHRKDRLEPEQFPRFAAALLLAFMLGFKVLSPQYVIWLLPLVPLSVGGAWGLGVSAVFLAICWMTAQVYPYHYLEIVQGRPPGTDILLGRNLLLVILWALMLSLPAGSKPGREPADKPVVTKGGEP